MTPEQFAAKMRYISSLPADAERTRRRLIECMADALEDMGFKDGVSYFRKIEEVGSE